eukprot:jgi/Psemu1/50759/gm1.50759_g
MTGPLMNMLNCIKKILPIRPDQWEHVAQLCAENYPHSERDVDSIQRKYQKLHRKSIPTGDPNIPDDIALAKEIKYMIDNNYTPIWEHNKNDNNAIRPIGQPSQLTSSFSVEPLALVSESVIAEAPLSLSSAKSKKAKKKISYKMKATSYDVVAAFHLSFEQQERNAVRARQEQQETMNYILSLARAHFSSHNSSSSGSSSDSNSNSNSNSKHTCDESNNPMVE